MGISQTNKLATNPFMNPDKKPVLVYAPAATYHQEQEMLKAGATKVVKNTNELLGAYRELP